MARNAKLEGGNTLALVTAKREPGVKASTAALRPFSQRVSSSSDVSRVTRLAVLQMCEANELNAKLRYRNKGLLRDEAIHFSRDIINILFTCLPTKNCLHRIRAVTFALVLP